MKFTGERPTLENKDEIMVSRIRYHSILPFCINRSIMDLGCGIGHGSFYLSDYTDKQVTGYDISEEAIHEAKQLFIKTNLSFKVINNLEDLNFEEVDLLTMVEFIEHLEKPEADKFFERLSSIEHLSIALTTPNGDQFSYHPTSPEQYHGYHRWHYTFYELLDLKKYFKFIKVYADVFDPVLKKFTSYVVFASNTVDPIYFINNQ